MTNHHPLCADSRLWLGLEDSSQEVLDHACLALLASFLNELNLFLSLLVCLVFCLLISLAVFCFELLEFLLFLGLVVGYFVLGFISGFLDPLCSDYRQQSLIDGSRPFHDSSYTRAPSAQSWTLPSQPGTV